MDLEVVSKQMEVVYEELEEIEQPVKQILRVSATTRKSLVSHCGDTTSKRDDSFELPTETDNPFIDKTEKSPFRQYESKKSLGNSNSTGSNKDLSLNSKPVKLSRNLPDSKSCSNDDEPSPKKETKEEVVGVTADKKDTGMSLVLRHTTWLQLSIVKRIMVSIRGVERLYL